MGESLKTAIVIAASLGAVILISVIVLFFVIKIQTAARRRRIEGYGRESEVRIDSLLKNAFGEDAVFSGIYLPYQRSETKKHAEIDHLVITRNGIFVIEVKSHNGYIRCPDEREWWQTYNEKKISFYNPLRQNKTHSKIVSEILKTEGQYNIHIQSVVVFTSHKVTFSQKYPNVIKENELVGYIKKNGRKNSLSTSQVRRIRELIKRTAKKSEKDKSVARRHKRSFRSFK